ncbi:hypothetical protein VTK73DRAFT_2849 [Phialemonium thermophilum]|uniref:HpcH/HpaI aldolase/citrate lyase domain-containing protein n=1 Tax=Phialemonium thermophilum TaxID=223376 RepID=A0ABR3X239_9PEZI
MASAPSGDMAAYAAPSLFQPHRAREAIRDAHEKKIPPILGYYAGLTSLPITRLLAPMGFDAVWIDWEHTPCDIETMTTIVHETMFLSQGRTIPFVRVPGHDHAAIGYALDAGASIIAPQVETVEQAKKVVSYTKFGAKNNGTRSVPPFRLFSGISDAPYDPSRTLHECLNDQAALVIQIESLEAINNLDAILSEVPEIDAVWLGRLDARVSMGLPVTTGVEGDEPEWQEAREKFMAAMDKHNKPLAGFGFASPPSGSPEACKAAAARMSFMIVSVDVAHLLSMRKELATARELAVLPRT